VKRRALPTRRGGRGALRATVAVLLAAAPAAAESPRILYLLHCQGCHLADGSGKAGEVPPLAPGLAAFPSVAGGRAYLVQVPGSAHAPLSDAELAAVLNWMIASFAPAAGAPAPYDAAEVARYRATPLVDVAAARAELLRRLAERRAPRAGMLAAPRSEGR
jgi:mono/diheme cytochrome c family protein